MSELVLLVVAVAAVAVAASVWLGRRRGRIWRRFARRYGLTFVAGAGPPRVEGHVGERPVRLEVTDASSDTGLLGVREIVLKVALLQPSPERLRVLHRTGLEPVTGERDTALGDASFDDQALVDAPAPELARAWLTAERREALLELLGLPEPSAAGLADGSVFLEERRAWSSLRHLDDRLVLLLRVARRLDGGG